MITSLHGRLVESLANRITIDVHGVGYEVFVPLSSIEAIGRTGDEVRVLTHLHVREQEQTLFGFSRPEERDLFRLLINRVSGVGPKLAMAVLSGMSVESFKQAVVHADIEALSRISGLGKKTAERIILELKDKVGVAAAWEAASSEASASSEHAQMNDAILALISLGYKQVDAQKAVKKVHASGETAASADELIRAALRLLS